MYELWAGVDFQSKEGNISQGLLYLALAVGGQCQVSSPLNLQYSRKYFARGQQIAFEGILEDPSIKPIYSFLLMAFYLLGACRRNAVFMHLGVAARAAHALGLHKADQYRALNNVEQSLRYVQDPTSYYTYQLMFWRLRTWKSVRILDVMVSSILARPSASISTRPDTCIGSINNHDRASRGWQ